ncbi:hypothetical protein VTJ04DRAFT_8866 [Mycothermus thermophilus]|uniref:uncharacterized protein n=1 Tax=Humicola insolens TaxID=85995 RepID=UPI00374223A2
MLLFDSASEGIPFAKSVLTVARRYEAPPDDELVGQVARKVGAGASDKILKVGTVWMLSCLADTFITVSSLPWNSIRGDSILVDERMGSDILIVEVDRDGGPTNVAVDRDCNYVDLLVKLT